jgi:hypothetical protein
MSMSGTARLFSGSMAVLCAALLLATSAWAQPRRPAPIPPDAGGRWMNRSFVLDIKHDGHAMVTWRTYVWCGPRTTGACDRDADEWGGMAAITFLEFDGATASGRVDWSTSEASLEAGPVRFTVRPDGVGELRQGEWERLLCGPSASRETAVFWCGL